MRTILVAALLLTSCASTPEARSTGAPATTKGAWDYESLDEIADAIGCTDLQDVGTGGNAGLRAFGVCHLDGHNLDVYLVSDHSWDHLKQQFHTVSGSGWIVVCPTGARAARLVHREIGGEIS